MWISDILMYSNARPKRLSFQRVANQPSIYYGSRVISAPVLPKILWYILVLLLLVTLNRGFFRDITVSKVKGLGTQFSSTV